MDLMSASFGIFCGLVVLGIFFFCAVGMAVLDVVILVAFLKRRKLVELCLAVISLSFVIALVYESQGPRSPAFVASFFFLYFILPLINFCYLIRTGRIQSKSKSRSERLFENATIAALLPSLMGLFFAMLYSYNVLATFGTCVSETPLY